MADLLLPAVVAALAWWFSTGAILWLVHRWPHVNGAGAVGLCVTGLIAILVAQMSAAATDAAGAYLSFGAALALWGAIEISFLTGWITGPNRAMCPPDVSGLRRFRLAAGSVMHHEVLIAACLVVLALATLGQGNQTALAVFGTLALMRLSAKLNLFFGAPNLSDGLAPPSLRHLRSYFHHAVFNPLFPVSLLVGATLAAIAATVAISAPPFSSQETGAALTFALLVLALLEHALMMTPLDDSRLWRWAAKKTAAPRIAPINQPPSSPARASHALAAFPIDAKASFPVDATALGRPS